ncbi:PP2C family protein-serine/threonine phosphatase [Kocuria sp. CPCC 205300]|uniref:PP2C family protein-serine/threonine phosphatase n=1 Tax=Kocuria sabuli TaxID=3071448 RepID=UPI0036DD1CE7
MTGSSGATPPEGDPSGLPPAQDAQELARLAALHELGLLETAPEEHFERIVALARLVFQVPVAAIALVDADRQWIKAASGLDAGVAVPLRYSPCHYTVQQPGALVLEDTARGTWGADTTVVRQGMRFYAGQPLRARTGERVGSLCIMDTVPRTFGADEQEVLAQLGQLVERELAATGELAAAGAAQRMLLPAGAVGVPGYELAGRCTPARRAGGSYFDWHVEDGRVQLEAADVLGAASAAVASGLRALLRATGPGRARRWPVERTVERSAVGAPAAADGTGAFVTAFAATLDASSGTVVYVLAGYGAALVLGADGGVRRLAGSGPALGLSPAYGSGWDVRTAALRPGETLLVLTDGFLDLRPDAPPAGGLDTVARRYPGGIGADEAVDLATAWAVTEGHPIDLTVLALHRLPEPSPSKGPGSG